GSDSATNLQVVTGSSASARSVHVAAAPPLSLAAGSFFALGADIDIAAANDGPSVALLQPDGSGDVANLSYRIEYVLDDPDDDLDASLGAALYAYPSPGLRTVQDIRIFGTLIADQNDRVARNAAGTDDLEQGSGDYTWDEPPAALVRSALFASILRLPSGTYYIYLVADDGGNPPVFAVSPGPVTIVHSPVVRQIDPPAAETVDTGVRTGVMANPYDLDFAIVDYDSDARVQLFYSAFAGLTSVSASGAYPNQSFALGKSLAGTRGQPITAAASLSARTTDYSWDVSEPLVAAGAYYLYAVATDGTSVTVGQSPARLTVRHSPSFTFYEPVRNTQRTIDTGSQPVYTIQWQKGPGDGDLDDDASIALYYTAVNPAAKNYTGADSTDLVDAGDGNATLIAGPLHEDGDGAADMYVWDFRRGGSVPPEDRQVWLYAVVSDPGGNAAVELGGSLTLRHSPYVLLRTRLPEVNQGDALRLEWEDYMVDDGSGTDDAYLRLYASRQPGLTTLAQLESELGSGATWVINSIDGTAAGATPLRESGGNALTWDTRTSAFALPEGTYSVYAGISGDATFADNATGRVSEAANQLSVRAATGVVPHVALSPNRVVASAGDTLTFEVLMQSDGVAATALSIGIDLPAGAFEVLNPASPFTDLGAAFAGGTVLEDTTINGQPRFSKTGVAEVLGSGVDLVAVASFQVVAQSLTGLQVIGLSGLETAISTESRSAPLRRSTGMSALEAEVRALPRGRIEGYVLLEGRAPPLGNGDHSALLDVHLRLPGSVLDIEDGAYRSANDAHPATPDTVQVQTASDGQFRLTSIPSGRYVLTVKDTSHLSGRTDTITVRPGESVRLTSALGFYASDIRGDASFLLPRDGRLLQAGDATGDNEVDEDDINAIDAAWGTNPARPRFAEADLNNDGRVGV
ncbi:MAG: carboxypeptidase-like regulatory domain-containing protein, partial [Gemmatimonadota bacterium]